MSLVAPLLFPLLRLSFARLRLLIPDVEWSFNLPKLSRPRQLPPGAFPLSTATIYASQVLSINSRASAKAVTVIARRSATLASTSPTNIAKMEAFSLWACLLLLPLLPSSNAAGIPSLPAKTGSSTQPDPAQVAAIVPTTAPEFHSGFLRRQAFMTDCGFISGNTSSLFSVTQSIPLADVARAQQVILFSAATATSASQNATMLVAATPQASLTAISGLHVSTTTPIRPGSAWARVPRHDAGKPLCRWFLADS